MIKLLKKTWVIIEDIISAFASRARSWHLEMLGIISLTVMVNMFTSAATDDELDIFVIIIIIILLLINSCCYLWLSGEYRYREMAEYASDQGIKTKEMSRRLKVRIRGSFGIKIAFVFAGVALSGAVGLMIYLIITIRG